MMEESGVSIQALVPSPHHAPIPPKKQEQVLLQSTMFAHFCPKERQCMWSRSWKLVSISGKNRCKRVGRTQMTSWRNSTCAYLSHSSLYLLFQPQNKDSWHKALCIYRWTCSHEVILKNYLEDERHWTMRVDLDGLYGLKYGIWPVCQYGTS